VSARRGQGTSGTWIFLALGGTLVVAIAYLFVPRGSGAADALSAPQGPAIESRVPATALSRDHVVLRWTPSPGATYSLALLDGQGRALQNARNLRQSEYDVPASAFAGLPPNSRVVWRVGATLADGSKITSKEFHSVIQ
jgi:hypothetical protein